MTAFIQEWRRSKNLVLVVVTVAVWLDALQCSVIVPMLPDFLESLQLAESSANADNSTFRNTTAGSGDASGISGAMSTKIGLLLASKTLFELLASPFFGSIGDRFGYTVPMFFGFFITFTSTLLFAFAESYEVLFLARSIHGLGAAAVNAPGLGLVADKFPDEKERGPALSTSYGGAVFGVVVGPVFGGVMYLFYGKTVTFLVLAAATLIDGCLRALIVEPKKKAKDEKCSTMWELLADPYIRLVLGALFIGVIGVTVLDVILPLWVKNSMNANSAEQGLFFLPLTVTLLLTVNLFSNLSLRVGRYWMVMIGLIFMGINFILLPIVNSVVLMIIIIAFLGVGIGSVQCAFFPELGHLVDMRHSPSYGTVYGLANSTFGLAYFSGASLGGILVSHIGLQWTFTVLGGLCFLYSPLLCYLRVPYAKEELKPLKNSLENAAVL